MILNFGVNWSAQARGDFVNDQLMLRNTAPLCKSVQTAKKHFVNMRIFILS